MMGRAVTKAVTHPPTVTTPSRPITVSTFPHVNPVACSVRFRHAPEPSRAGGVFRPPPMRSVPAGIGPGWVAT